MSWDHGRFFRRGFCSRFFARVCVRGRFIKSFSEIRRRWTKSVEKLAVSNKIPVSPAVAQLQQPKSEARLSSDFFWEISLKLWEEISCAKKISLAPQPQSAEECVDFCFVTLHLHVLVSMLLYYLGIDKIAIGRLWSGRKNGSRGWSGRDTRFIQGDCCDEEDEEVEPLLG